MKKIIITAAFATLVACGQASSPASRVNGGGGRPGTGGVGTDEYHGKSCTSEPLPSRRQLKLALNILNPVKMGNILLRPAAVYNFALLKSATPRVWDLVQFFVDGNLVDELPYTFEPGSIVVSQTDFAYDESGRDYHLNVSTIVADEQYRVTGTVKGARLDYMVTCVN